MTKLKTNLNKTDLINLLSESSGQTKKDTEIFLNTFIDTVSTQVSQGNKVQLVGFGTYELRERKERKGRNPQTGEEMLIPASKIPAFRAGKQFRELCN